jgi:glycosyltransferase involved in cell wall biosynthesis
MADVRNLNRIGVCFVCPKAYPLFNPACKATFGGAEVDLYLLGTQLAKDPAFDVSFVTADYGQPKEEMSDHVTIFKSLTFRENPLSGAWKIWRAMKKARADIYVLKTASPGVPLAAWFCRLHKKHLVYRTASMLECNGRWFKDHKFLGKAFIWGLRNANMVFTQNANDCANLQETLGISSQVISNGLSIPPINPINKEYILWAGRSKAVKGPQRLIELAKQFPNEKFLMICPPATGDSDYENLKKDAISVPNLAFLGKVPFHEMNCYFQKAKILVNTSDSEGFANTFIQAGAAGAAILSFKVNPDDFLIKYNCGLCCFGDMDKLAMGLRFLLENNRYLEIGQNGRKYVEARHDISKIVEEYKAIFVRLTEQKQRNSNH